MTITEITITIKSVPCRPAISLSKVSVPFAAIIHTKGPFTPLTKEVDHLGLS